MAKSQIGNNSKIHFKILSNQSFSLIAKTSVNLLNILYYGVLFLASVVMRISIKKTASPSKFMLTG